MIKLLYYFQKQCIDFALNARPRSLFMPEDKSSMKYRIWRLVTSTPFEYFIMAMICCNTIILMMKVCFSVLKLSFFHYYFWFTPLARRAQQILRRSQVVIEKWTVSIWIFKRE